MISCIVIEDQMPARKILQKFIGEVDVLELKGMFTNALDALDYLRDNSVDLLFLDIHLPKLSGIDFLSVLTQKQHVILTTAFPDYALQGYDLDVVDYLLKPFSFERFLRAVIKVERLNNTTNTTVEKQKPESILVKVGYDTIKIQLDDITYIHADGDYSYIFCKDKKYHASYSLKYWIDNLPSSRFFQVHRSYLVNIFLVNKISSNHVVINNFEIPVGRVFKKKFQEAFLNLQE